MPRLGNIYGISTDSFIKSPEIVSEAETTSNIGPTKLNLNKLETSGINPLTGDKVIKSPSFIEGLGGLQGIGVGLQGLGSLGSLVLGSKNYGLAKDTFNFNKNMKQKEYAMAKDAYDRNVARATSIGNQMNAGKVG